MVNKQILNNNRSTFMMDKWEHKERTPNPKGWYQESLPGGGGARSYVLLNPLKPARWMVRWRITLVGQGGSGRWISRRKKHTSAISGAGLDEDLEGNSKLSNIFKFYVFIYLRLYLFFWESKSPSGGRVKGRGTSKLPVGLDPRTCDHDLSWRCLTGWVTQMPLP